MSHAEMSHVSQVSFTSCYLTCRFESAGPNWPARRSVNAIGEDTGKETTEAGRSKIIRQDPAGQGQCPAFTPVPDQPQV